MIKLFGPDRQLLGYEDQEWAVWVSGMDDVLPQPDLITALVTAGEQNAALCGGYDGHPHTPVAYAVVLHHGYAWAQSVEHQAGRDCGMRNCTDCGARRAPAPELKSLTADEWAMSLAAAGLEPGPAFAYRLASGPYEAAVHIATSTRIDTDARRELADGIQDAASGVIWRILGRLPVATLRRNADGSTSETAL
ncbi:hypothetical protein ABZX85_23165 [Streptomyces sp. NPDC004539]|uniref:hypothetical protein n=1 Tax=Streptomyces sp. NPDC004539 TaxID=3154280 RepID=UPI0033A1C32F